MPVHQLNKHSKIEFEAPNEKTLMLKIVVKKLVLFSFAIILFSSCIGQTYDKGILAGTLIDGNGGSPQKNKLILIKENKIVGIKDANEKNKYNFKSFIDAHNKFIIPGLIEMHSHVTMTHREAIPAPGTVFGEQLTVTYYRPASEWILKTLLSYGITTLRETADFLDEGLQLKKDIEEKKIMGPYMFTCGPLIESEPRLFKQMSVVVHNEEEARKEVKRQIAAGVDFIKIYADLKPELARVVIDEAHKGKIRVLGHVQTTSCLQAVQYGIDAFVHSLLVLGTVQKDSIKMVFKLMSEKHIPMDIQMGYGFHLLQMMYDESPSGVRVRESVPDTIIKGWYQELRSFTRDSLQKRLIRSDSFMRAHASLAKEMGVKVFIGTDTPTPFIFPGLSFHHEMQAFSLAGYSNSEIIQIATHDHAEWLGILLRKGTLEAGKDADLVILNADPIADIKNTLKIFHVFREGRMVK